MRLAANLSVPPCPRLQFRGAPRSLIPTPTYSQVPRAKTDDDSRVHVQCCKGADRGNRNAELINTLNDPNVVIAGIRDRGKRQRSGGMPRSIHAPLAMIEIWIDPDSSSYKDAIEQVDKIYAFTALQIGGQS